MSRKLNRWIDGQEDRWMKQLKTLTLGPSPSNDYTEIEYTNYLPSYSEKIGSQEQWPNQEGNRHHSEDCLEGEGVSAQDLQHLLQWIQDVVSFHLDRLG